MLSYDPIQIAHLTKHFYDLLHDYFNIDYMPLRQFAGFKPNWEDQQDFNLHSSAMLTALAIAYKGDIASVVRYCRGPYTGEHRATNQILTDLESIIDTESMYRPEESVQ